MKHTNSPLHTGLLTVFLFLGTLIPVFGQEDIISADVLYNKGTEAYSKNDFGTAVYYFEKAKLLDPFSNDLKINLKLSQERIESDIVELDGFFLSHWWKGFSNVLLPGGWKMLSILLLLGFLGLLYFQWLKEPILSRNRFFALLSFLFVFFLLSLFAGNTRYNDIFNNEFGIVNEKGNHLLEGPDVVSEKVKEITHGVKVKIIDSSGAWFKVAAMDSEQGWIKKEELTGLSF